MLLLLFQTQCFGKQLQLEAQLGAGLGGGVAPSMFLIPALGKARSPSQTPPAHHPITPPTPPYQLTTTHPDPHPPPRHPNTPTRTQVDAVPMPLGPDNPHLNGFTAVETDLTSTSAAQRLTAPDKVGVF